MIKAQQLFSGASRLLQTEVEMVRSIMGWFI
jgi:flagellar hook-associated protein FlgK